MTEPILHAASKGHTHGGSDVPLQTRSERLRSVIPSEHTQIDGRDEQWRYLDSNRLGGLDTNTLNNVSTDLQLVAPAEFATEVVDASDPSFGTAGLPEDLPTANAWAAADSALKITLSGEASEPAILSIKDVSTSSAAHLIVQSKTHSRGTVVIDHTGKGNLAEIIEILVGDESSLTVVSIQDCRFAERPWTGSPAGSNNIAAWRRPNEQGHCCLQETQSKVSPRKKRGSTNVLSLQSEKAVS
jgi:Fe-S cluster assembly protein SufD